MHTILTFPPYRFLPVYEIQGKLGIGPGNCGVRDAGTDNIEVKSAVGHWFGFYVRQASRISDGN